MEILFKVLLIIFTVLFMLFGALYLIRSLTKKKAKAVGILWVISMLCLFAVVISGLFLAPSKDKETPSETVYTDVAFEEIYAAYKNNELSADDKYKGNRYQIACTFVSVGDGGLNGALGSLSVTAYTYVGNKKCVLWCTFDEETQREALSKLNKGDEFTFEGICDSWGRWSDCKVVN